MATPHLKRRYVSTVRPARLRPPDSHEAGRVKPRKDRTALLVAASGLAGVVLASVIAAGNSLYLDRQDGKLQQDLLQAQFQQSQITAHDEFSRAQKYSAYTQAQLNLGKFSEAALMCVAVFTQAADAFSPDLKARQAAVSYVQKQVLAPMEAATNSLVDVAGAIDIIASDQVRTDFDLIQTQSQTYRNDCKELANAMVNATPAEKAAGSVSPGGMTALIEMKSLSDMFDKSEFVELTPDMSADFAPK
jgi:hypothetical protein